MKITTVTVLGLGAMGHAFAMNLVKNDFQLRVWNRTQEKGEDLQLHGAILAKNPVEAVEESEAVILMLADAESTLYILDKVLPSLSPNAILVQMGTIGIAATEQIATLINAQRPDIGFIDAPVSGTKKPAEAAQITILASGAAHLKPMIEPVFSAISKGTHWLGEAGAGSAMKLVVNSWLIGMVQSLAESYCLAEHLGFTPETLWSVLEGGPLAAPYVKTKLAMISEGDFTPQMQLKWALKDANLASESGKAAQLPNLQAITKIWQEAVEAGFGEKDLSAVAQYLMKQ